MDGEPSWRPAEAISTVNGEAPEAQAVHHLSPGGCPDCRDDIRWLVGKWSKARARVAQLEVENRNLRRRLHGKGKEG